jgi:two-component system, NarL family, sensor histidine kinase DesK
MRHEQRWWDGPWPWLAYLATYPIPWLWVPPSQDQLLLSALAFALFVPTYLASFRLGGRALPAAILAMTAIGVASAPIGGGWTVFAVYPAMQAARLRPRRAGVLAVVAVILAFLVTGLIGGLPLVWWAPSLLLPALLGGAALSRQAFYERTHALLRSQEEVRRLAGIAERERMARDLHDTVGRTLTLLALRADLVSRLAVRDGEAAGAEARLIAAEARAGLEEVSAALHGQGCGSLEAEIGASTAALSAAGVDAQVVGDASKAPRDAGALLAMTLREAVTNVIRHANAARCIIEIDVGGDHARLSVSDDGTGGPIGEGNGLTGMRQRLLAAGGGMALIERRPGTTLLATVPL